MAMRSGWEFIFDAVDSVMDQTYTNWELLIAVNGFPEDSLQYRIADLFAYYDSRIRPYDCPGCKSKPQALNLMRGIAKGNYVAILDVDDVWQPDKLKIQQSLPVDCDVIGTLAEYFGSESGPIDVKQGTITFDDLLERNHIINSSVLLPRELAVWDETDELDDYPLWLKLAHEGKVFYNVPKTLTKIRCHPDQWFAGKRDNSDALRQIWAAKERQPV